MSTAKSTNQRPSLASNPCDIWSHEVEFPIRTLAAKDIAAETGLGYRPVADGQRVAGIYRRSVMLASGRYALLDEGMGFSLVPWKPVLEQRLGQQLVATMRGGSVSWKIGRRRYLSIQ